MTASLAARTVRNSQCRRSTLSEQNSVSVKALTLLCQRC